MHAAEHSSPPSALQPQHSARAALELLAPTPSCSSSRSHPAGQRRISAAVISDPESSSGACQQPQRVRTAAAGSDPDIGKLETRPLQLHCGIVAALGLLLQGTSQSRADSLHSSAPLRSLRRRHVEGYFEASLAADEPKKSTAAVFAAAVAGLGLLAEAAALASRPT